MPFSHYFSDDDDEFSEKVVDPQKKDFCPGHPLFLSVPVDAQFSKKFKILGSMRVYGVTQKKGVPWNKSLFFSCG
jgi:hypothetical protein